MFYKPDGDHYIFKNNVPRWICKDEKLEYEDCLLFEKIFGKKFVHLTEKPKNGF